MPLSDSTTRSAKAKGQVVSAYRRHGLCLEVPPTGSKLWCNRYRLNGSAKIPAFGASPAVTLLKARQLRDGARQLLIEGTAPPPRPAGEHKKTAKQVQKVDGLTSKRWRVSGSSITPPVGRKYKLQGQAVGIRCRPAKAITRPDLVELARKVEARGTLNAAGKICQWLHQIFQYGLAKSVVDANPARDLSVVAAPPNAARHHPHVTFAELPELLAKSEAANINSLTRYAIRLLALTAVRPGELRQAPPWAEFDLGRATWTIPVDALCACANVVSIRRPA